MSPLSPHTYKVLAGQWPFSKFYVVTEEVGTRTLGQFSKFLAKSVNSTFQNGEGQTAFGEQWAAMLCAGGVSWVHK